MLKQRRKAAKKIMLAKILDYIRSAKQQSWSSYLRDKLVFAQPPEFPQLATVEVDLDKIMADVREPIDRGDSYSLEKLRNLKMYIKSNNGIVMMPIITFSETRESIFINDGRHRVDMLWQSGVKVALVKLLPEALTEEFMSRYCPEKSFYTEVEGRSYGRCNSSGMLRPEHVKAYEPIDREAIFKTPKARKAKPAQPAEEEQPTKSHVETLLQPSRHPGRSL